LLFADLTFFDHPTSSPMLSSLSILCLFFIIYNEKHTNSSSSCIYQESAGIILIYFSLQGNKHLLLYPSTSNCWLKQNLVLLHMTLLSQQSHASQETRLQL
jgi:hypothetical protein